MNTNKEEIIEVLANGLNVPERTVSSITDRVDSRKKFTNEDLRSMAEIGIPIFLYAKSVFEKIEKKAFLSEDMWATLQEIANDIENERPIVRV